MKRAYTLVELLIVVALLALLATGFFIAINPLKQIQKAHDAERKADLTSLQKALEDRYGDKGCYPQPSEICYDATVNVCSSEGDNWVSQTCNICGDESTSPSFGSYLDKLPCDPIPSRKKYRYEVESKTGVACTQTGTDITNECPQWYRVYAQFDNPVNSGSDSFVCGKGGCGFGENSIPSPGNMYPYPYGYDYGVSSPNTTLEYSTSWFCLQPASNRCKHCGNSFSECEAAGVCEVNQIYGTKNSCCAVNPNTKGCIAIVELEE